MLRSITYTHSICLNYSSFYRHHRSSWDKIYFTMILLWILMELWSDSENLWLLMQTVDVSQLLPTQYSRYKLVTTHPHVNTQHLCVSLWCSTVCVLTHLTTGRPPTLKLRKWLESHFLYKSLTQLWVWIVLFSQFWTRAGGSWFPSLFTSISSWSFTLGDFLSIHHKREIITWIEYICAFLYAALSQRQRNTVCSFTHDLFREFLGLPL